jgi:ubiquinone/menaquinone biosynthesis C-methylase UbiE
VSLWGRIFAAGYDKFMAETEEAGLARHREQLLADVRGRVLEIGGGTGANLPHYPRGIAEIVITEPEAPMARRLPAHALPARVVSAPAEKLPFEDASFDVAVSTLVLCTVGVPALALAEIHRVLKPDGQLLFIEHSGQTTAESLAGKTGSTACSVASATAATATAARWPASRARGSR